MPVFEELFAQHVQPHLSSPETYPEAIDALQSVMTQMETKLDRAKAYQWLGIMHVSLASEALQLQDIDEVKKQFALVEEFHVKSIEEDPTRLEPRLNLARYYLTFGDRHQAAFETLEFENPEDEKAAEDQPLPYRHQRMALRGVALAFMARPDEAGDALDKAYSDEFLQNIPSEQVDLSSLNYLAMRGYRLTPESIEQFLGRLKAAGALDDGQEEELRMKLLGARDDFQDGS